MPLSSILTPPIKQTIVLSALVLVLLTLLLAYLSSRSLYRPISRLKAMIGGESERKTEQTDEIGTIGILCSRRSMIGTTTRRSLTKVCFFKGAIQVFAFAPALHDFGRIESKKAYLGVDIDSHDLVVLALSLDDHNIRGIERGMITNITNISSSSESWTKSCKIGGCSLIFN